MARRIVRIALYAAAGLVVIIAAFAGYVGAGWESEAQVDGRIAGMPVREPVTILRDDRGVPHIRAKSIHDAFVAEGFVEGSDRLFQIDLMRHFVFGRLSEWFGSRMLQRDESARVYHPELTANAEYRKLSAQSRMELDAFAQGVNAAMRTQPLPIEYRLLFVRPKPWRAQDTLALGYLVDLLLGDSWHNVVERNHLYDEFGQPAIAGLFPITDPKYAAPTTGRPPGPVAFVPPLPLRKPATALHSISPTPSGIGSNNWAVGGTLGTDGSALLSNDPHLPVLIPGYWYLVDLSAPGLHVAGATFPGTPGVVLGHNENIAWGATDATVATVSVYRAGKPIRTHRETFHVRFGKDVTKTYADDRHGFIVGSYSIDWIDARDPRSPFTAFMGVDRAKTIEDAIRSFRSFEGGPENFVFADRNGRAGYHMAGYVPHDPYWGLRVHSQGDPSYSGVPYDELPHVDPSRSAAVFSANNRVYGTGYPYRLSPNFAAPYRAKRIETLLHERRRHDVAEFEAMQNDTLSYPDLELAHDVVAAADRRHPRDPQEERLVEELRHWDGRVDGDSRAATAAVFLRRAATGRFTGGLFGKNGPRYASSAQSGIVAMLRAIRAHQHGYVAHDDYDGFLLHALDDARKRYPTTIFEPWRTAGAVQIKNVLGYAGIEWWNGAKLPGDGDAFDLHVERANGLMQSFRAVWDTRDWDAGGIAMPTGESGREGSPHYNDEAQAWVAHRMLPLPFSASSVAAAARHRLILTP